MGLIVIKRSVSEDGRGLWERASATTLRLPLRYSMLKSYCCSSSVQRANLPDGFCKERSYFSEWWQWTDIPQGMVASFLFPTGWHSFSVVEYFLSKSVRVPSLWNKTAPRPSWLASVWRKNGRLKSGQHKTGASVSACFNRTNAAFCSVFQTHLTLFLNNRLSGPTRFEKFGTKRL